jgi:hypothetical protein
MGRFAKLSDLGDGGGAPVQVADTQSIPFDASITNIAQHVVTADITITPNTSGAVAGCGAIQRIIADGVHTVDVSAFNKVSTSGNYINTLHVVNLFVWLFDGYNYNLTIFQNGDEYPHEIDAWAARLLTEGYAISSPRKSALDDFITAAKANGYYNSLTEFWLLEGGTAATNVLGFRGLSDGVIHGTITHASTGSTGDRATGWMDLGLSINDLGSGDDIHLCAYLRKSVSAGDDALGIRTGGGGVDDTYISPRQSVGYYNIDNQYIGAASPADPSGRFIMIRLGTSAKVYRNGTQIASNTLSSTVVASATKFSAFASRVGISTADAFSDQEIGFISLGKGLSPTQVAALDAALATLMTAWSR